MLKDFVVSQVGTQTHFVPNRTFIRRAFAVIVGGMIFTLVIGYVAYRDEQRMIVIGPKVPLAEIWVCFVLALLAVLAILMWRDRSLPLIVDAETGEVRYGKKLVCEPGSVKAVQLRCSSTEADENNCEFSFVLDYGTVKEIPAAWFASLNATDAQELAETIAALLKVGVQKKEPFFGIKIRYPEK